MLRRPAKQFVRQCRVEFVMVVGHGDHEGTDERLFALRDAARKYGVDPVELPARLEAYRARLDELSGDDDPLSAARAAAAATRETFISAAQKLTVARTEAARRLSATVGAELPPLRMEKAVFETAVEPLKESDWTDSGCDLVEFRIATNPKNIPTNSVF